MTIKWQLLSSEKGHGRLILFLRYETDLFTQALITTSKSLDKFAILTGHVIGPLTFLIMLLTCLVVALRYLFNEGATALQESVIYFHGIVFMLGIAFTLQQSEHVRVDIFYQRFSDKGKATINIMGTLFFLFPLTSFIFWTSYDYVAFSWTLGEVSAEPGGLPFVYLLKTLIPIMAILLFLQGLSELCKNLSVIVLPVKQEMLKDG